MVKPTGWVVDMQHYLDEVTGDLPEVIPERVPKFRDRGSGAGRTFARVAACPSSRRQAAANLSLEVLHTAAIVALSACVKSLNTHAIESNARSVGDVCDNPRLTARKSLILNAERCPSG